MLQFHPKETVLYMKNSNVGSIACSLFSAVASKSCCILPLFISIIGGSIGRYSILVMMFCIPCVAFPSLAIAHYKTWTGRNRCFTKPWQKNLNLAILFVSTLLFLYVASTAYIPCVNAVLHGKTLDDLAPSMSCPFCRPQKT